MKNLGRMIEMAKKNDPEMIEEILKVTPDRIHTILPGMIVLQTAAKKVRAKTIVVSSFGVREGYLYDRVMKPLEGAECISWQSGIWEDL